MKPSALADSTDLTPASAALTTAELRSPFPHVGGGGESTDSPCTEKTGFFHINTGKALGQIGELCARGLRAPCRAAADVTGGDAPC